MEPPIRTFGRLQLKSIFRRLRARLVFSIDSYFRTDRALARSLRLDIEVASRISQFRYARTSQHLVVPTVGMGNIGDQAMLESFFRRTTFPVTLLVQHKDGHEVPADARGRVTVALMPDLYATRPWVRRKVRRKVASLIARHSTLSIIGADIMDGGYDAAQSAIRFGMLCMGNELGTATRVLGFSWNGAPPESVSIALRSSQPKSLLCLRDPHSLARLGGDESFNLVQVSDMAFTMDEVAPYYCISTWLREQAGKPVVVMNVSGLLARVGSMTSDYVDIAKHLLQRGCSVVVLPHVIREGDDDLAASAELMFRLGSSPHVYLIENLLTPQQVAWVARQASAVLTGRMHLAILSINQGVPAAILATQGKVSGLLDYLDMPELLLEPAPGFAIAAIRALDQILDDPSIRIRLELHLPELRALAELNFTGLEGAR
jgi:colanic acid/amylovoran biosynthesis protein